MVSNKNIFCSSNPAKILSALWEVVLIGGTDFSRDIIFLPSRRAVRSVEKLFVDIIGDAVILPELIALGESPDDLDSDFQTPENTVSNAERIIVLAKLLSGDSNFNAISNALPTAKDLVRMQDYLDNESVSNVCWENLVSEKYAAHFQKKAVFLGLVSNVLPDIFDGKITDTAARNNGIRGWIKSLANYNRVIVCGSTGSVPATADLIAHIATMPNGFIILPGKISGTEADLCLDTNPYNFEYKLLQKIGIGISDVNIIDAGFSQIDFFNTAFSNSGNKLENGCSAHLIECARESEEAEVAAEIAARARKENKSVLIITPDAAGNQRIESAFIARGIIGDFSGGKNGTTTNCGRAILNLFDHFIDTNDFVFENIYAKNNNNLLQTIIKIIQLKLPDMVPEFEISEPDSVLVFEAISNLCDILTNNGIEISTTDARALIANCLSDVSIRPPMVESQICVLGTIESRMQTADVVILTGLNDGMFPAVGYENPWLPRGVSKQIGLPSPDRKVSLMSLDFMNLSCSGCVYWTRSRTAGGAQTTESRFISRADVCNKGFDKRAGDEILSAVRARDIVQSNKLDYSSPRPPADRSDVYVTELERLIHNPYAFYVSHILRLRVLDDYFAPVDARDFGNLVHKVAEEITTQNTSEIIAMLDARARNVLPENSIIFHFWHKRFLEIAPLILNMINNSARAETEIRGEANIAGRRVRAIADRVWIGNILDIKTGEAPSKTQLKTGTMPQLPLEAFILKSGGFGAGFTSQNPTIYFLQLQNNNIKMIEYGGDLLNEMIDNSVQKISELFGQYSQDFTPYEYRENSEEKYKIYDDLARVND